MFLNQDCIDTAVDYTVTRLADWSSLRTVCRAWRVAADVWVRGQLAVDQRETSTWVAPGDATRGPVDLTDAADACTSAAVRFRLLTSHSIAISKMLLASLHFRTAGDGRPCDVCRSLNCGPRPITNVGWRLWGRLGMGGSTGAGPVATWADEVFAPRVESLTLRVKEDCNNDADTLRLKQLTALRKVTLVETAEAKNFSLIAESAFADYYDHDDDEPVWRGIFVTKLLAMLPASGVLEEIKVKEWSGPEGNEVALLHCGGQLKRFTKLRRLLCGSITVAESDLADAFAAAGGTLEDVEFRPSSSMPMPHFVSYATAANAAGASTLRRIAVASAAGDTTGEALQQLQASLRLDPAGSCAENLERLDDAVSGCPMRWAAPDYFAGFPRIRAVSLTWEEIDASTGFLSSAHPFSWVTTLDLQVFCVAPTRDTDRGPRPGDVIACMFSALTRFSIGIFDHIASPPRIELPTSVTDVSVANGGPVIPLDSIVANMPQLTALRRVELILPADHDVDGYTLALLPASIEALFIERAVFGVRRPLFSSGNDDGWAPHLQRLDGLQTLVLCGGGVDGRVLRCIPPSVCHLHTSAVESAEDAALIVARLKRLKSLSFDGRGQRGLDPGAARLLLEGAAPSLRRMTATLRPPGAPGDPVANCGGHWRWEEQPYGDEVGGFKIEADTTAVRWARTSFS